MDKIIVIGIMTLVGVLVLRQSGTSPVASVNVAANQNATDANLLGSLDPSQMQALLNSGDFTITPATDLPRYYNPATGVM